MTSMMVACGGGGIDSHHYDRLSDYNGNWQSECRYDSSTDLTYIKTLYITDTQYTTFIDEYDNSDCFGNSDFTTEIEGVLYYGDYKPYASSYCENTIEVDFAATAVFEDGNEIPPAEIGEYLDLPNNNTSHNIMCTRNSTLYTGDLSLDDGRAHSSRPLSLDYDNPLKAF